MNAEVVQGLMSASAFETMCELYIVRQHVGEKAESRNHDVIVNCNKLEECSDIACGCSWS